MSDIIVSATIVFQNTNLLTTQKRWWWEEWPQCLQSTIFFLQSSYLWPSLANGCLWQLTILILSLSKSPFQLSHAAMSWQATSRFVAPSAAHARQGLNLKLLFVLLRFEIQNQGCFPLIQPFYKHSIEGIIFPSCIMHNGICSSFLHCTLRPLCLSTSLYVCPTLSLRFLQNHPQLGIIHIVEFCHTWWWKISLPNGLMFYTKSRTQGPC